MESRVGGDGCEDGCEFASAGHRSHVVSGGGDRTSEAWLANALNERHTPLRAGDVILSGSLGPLMPAAAGTTYRAEFSGVGAVHAVFTA